MQMQGFRHQWWELFWNYEQIPKPICPNFIEDLQLLLDVKSKMAPSNLKFSFFQTIEIMPIFVTFFWSIAGLEKY